ncbi:hypothetical protein D1007_26304 [Hordeum vulgare]|nr:hypothetical protein D1007_26304 [Hordeum vulgare]
MQQLMQMHKRALMMLQGLFLLIGIHLDDQDKEENGESCMPTNGNKYLSEDVGGQVMKDVAHDVDDAHDDELVNIYDKENLVIAVGKLFPNMKEFKKCFKSYAVNLEFDAKRPSGLIKGSFMQDAEVLMEVSSLASDTYLLDANLMEIPSRSIKSHIKILVL